MRKPKTIAMHIPKPCHENWDNMSPTEQGRFCHSCEKEVVSFANKTDAQIIAYFKNAPTKVCGQFRPEQLRTYKLPQQSLVSPRFRAITVGSLFSVITATAVYGQQPRQEQIFELPIPDSEVQLLGDVQVESTDSKHEVLGQITDRHTGKALFGATVQIRDAHNPIATDREGRFSLSIPEQYREKPFTVLISAPNYKMQVRVILPDQLPTTLYAKLVANNVKPREQFEQGEVQMIMGKLASPRN